MPRTDKIKLVRLDLLDIAGGNKIPRFRELLRDKPNPQRVVVISNRGSHTFYTLSNLFNNTKLIFLELPGRKDPYSMNLYRLYRTKSNVNLIKGNFLFLLIIELFYKLLFGRGTLFIGIGGHIKNPDKVYENNFLQALESCKKNSKVCHIFPIASGNMLDSFIYTVNKHNIKNQYFIGVTTGSPLSIPLLKCKYRKYNNIELKRPNRYDYMDYVNKADEFNKKYSVILDPIHSIHILDALDSKTIREYSQIILWITNPYIEKIIT